ncbi:hypothetical protein [Phnomibacter sp. MR]|uniref:hypothetical protein n=1 Tax=Phnomibacter sp. MR TaxID=3042318 RepID=UPI003A80DC09
MNTTNEASVPIAVFNSRSFRLPFLMSIFIIMQISMGAMFFPIIVGAPIWISAGVLFASIFLSIGLLAGHCSYSLHPQGITQQIRSFSWMPVFKKTTVRHFSWQDIQTYKMGSDLSRSMEQYNYLYISVRRFPYQLRLSDHQWDKQAFLHFVQAFEAQVTAQATQQKSPISTSSSSNTVLDAAPNMSIKRKPSFYERPIAHVVFWILAIGSGLLAWFMTEYELTQARYLNRFSVIIIPGLSYFAYRLYIKK